MNKHIMFIVSAVADAVPPLLRSPGIICPGGGYKNSDCATDSYLKRKRDFARCLDKTTAFFKKIQYSAEEALKNSNAAFAHLPHTVSSGMAYMFHCLSPMSDDASAEAGAIPIVYDFKISIKSAQAFLIE